MSNFIPIVSSSPPPLEDTGGFDDWGDDDDFGGFMAADQTQNEWNNSQPYNKTADQVNANLTSQIPQNFTAFLSTSVLESEFIIGVSLVVGMSSDVSWNVS
jgi:hypothetical protein